MKTLLAAISFMALSITFSGDAKADSCEYELVNRRGVVVDTVRAGSRYTTRYEACEEASRECREEKRYKERLSRRGSRGLTCQKVRLRPSRTLDRDRRGHDRGHGRVGAQIVKSCTYKFDRKNPRKKDTIHTAVGYGYTAYEAKSDACSNALISCAAQDLFRKGKCVKL